jgi:uncharacterized membrane protein
MSEETAMTTFSVWKFDNEQGAAEAARILRIAETDGLVKVDDHAVLTWKVGDSKPEVDHGHETVKRGAGWGALWGLVLGTLFLVPVVGGLVGAAIGVISRATSGIGIPKEDLAKIRTELTPGTSALFAVTEEGDLDRLGERFHGMHSTLVKTNLTEAEREMLLETFGSGVHAQK